MAQLVPTLGPWALTGERIRSRIILLPKDRGRPPNHPIPPHRPFVATAQHVRRWEGVWGKVLGAGISYLRSEIAAGGLL